MTDVHPTQLDFDCGDVNTLREEECRVLVTIYQQTNGASWADADDWLEAGHDPCEWDGVTCKNRSVTRLDLRDQGLMGELPEDIGDLTQLLTLKLSGNPAVSLPMQLGNLSTLKTLQLNRNGLTHLPVGFNTLTNLTELQLNDNQFTQIPDEIYALAQLDSLSLNNNHINRIDKNIGHLSNLTALSLDDNRIDQLPPEISTLSNLTYLSLQNNQIGQFPIEVTQLSTLTILALNGNRLTRIPPEISDLEALQELTLQENELVEIPQTIGDMERLQDLNLSDNPSRHIPFEFHALTKLKHLRLDNMALETLSPSLFDLDGLKTLWLSDNPSLTLSHEIGELSSLTDLKLNGNDITDIPEFLFGLYNLKRLELSNNQLTSLPEKINNLSALEELALNGNLLQTVSFDNSSLISVHTLELGDNDLGVFPDTLDELPNLRYLNIRGNNIDQLPSITDKLPNLIQLDLSSNRLRTVPDDIGEHLKLETLDLRANLLHCDGPSYGYLPSTIYMTIETLFLDYNCIDWSDDVAPLSGSLPASQRPGWANTQTLSPKGLTGTSQSHDSILLSWSPIELQGIGGEYEIEVRHDIDDNQTYTVDIAETTVPIANLLPDTTYSVRMRTHIPAHANHHIDLWSGYTEYIQVTTELGDTPPPPPTTPLSQTRTIFMYVIADNDLYPYLGNQIDKGMLARIESLQGIHQPGVRILMLFDGASPDDSFYYVLDEFGEWSAQPLGEVRMDDSITLENFLKWGIDKHSLSGYNMLSILGHANGSLGIGPDNTTNLEGNRALLEPQEIRTAIENVNRTHGLHFDVVHFDGCSFGLFENTSIVEGLAHYVIASPNTAWAIFAYEQYRAFAGESQTPKDYAQNVARYYADKLTMRAYPYTISVFDMQHYDSMKTTISVLGQALDDYIETPEGSAGDPQIILQDIRNSVQIYDSNDYHLDHQTDFYIDLPGLTDAFVSFEYSEAVARAAADVKRELTSFVMFTRTMSGEYYDQLSGTTIEINLDKANGIGIFYPFSKKMGNKSFDDYINHRLFPNLTKDWGWTTFLLSGIPPINTPEDPMDELSSSTIDLIPHAVGPLYHSHIYLPVIEQQID
ncbi:MAG: leucine-rich repeat domain-containing protein [Chloroflexota bacterium]